MMTVMLFYFYINIFVHVENWPSIARLILSSSFHLMALAEECDTLWERDSVRCVQTEGEANFFALGYSCEFAHWIVCVYLPQPMYQLSRRSMQASQQCVWSVCSCVAARASVWSHNSPGTPVLFLRSHSFFLIFLVKLKHFQHDLSLCCSGQICMYSCPLASLKIPLTFCLNTPLRCPETRPLDITAQRTTVPLSMEDTWVMMSIFQSIDLNG